MNSLRPYLIRALYDWIVDNGMTPHLLVNAAADGVEVPRQYVEDGKIVLNVSPTAVRDLLLANEGVEFSARFGGSPMWVKVPVHAVLAVYARENGQGMVFNDVIGPESAPEPEPPAPTKPSGPAGPKGPAKGSKGGRARLRVVK